MTVDFSKLGKMQAGKAARPSNLPVGTYLGRVKSWEWTETTRKDQKVGAIRVHVGLHTWPESVPDEDRLNAGNDGQPGKPIDLSKRQLSRDFTFDEQQYRLDDFIKSCNIAAEGMGYEEAMPLTVGAEVQVDVGTYTNQKAMAAGDLEGAVRNQINGLKGAV